MVLLHTILHQASSLRWELATSKEVVIGTFVSIIACIAAALLGSRLAAVALFPLAVIWVVVDQVVEGPTLLVLLPSHGVTMADLLSVLAVVVGTGRLALAWRQHQLQQQRRAGDAGPELAHTWPSARG